MAGYAGIYCIGAQGGFHGADGINSIVLQILVGGGSRTWLEVHYFDRAVRPIGNIRTIIPDGPDNPDALLDACLAYFPLHFAECPSLERVSNELADATHLDFDLGTRMIPMEWNRLREEARPLLPLLNIYFAALEPVRV